MGLGFVLVLWLFAGAVLPQSAEQFLDMDHLLTRGIGTR